MNFLMLVFKSDPISYNLFSIIVGILCLIEFIRSIKIAVTIKKTPYHKIESIAWNLLYANIILLGLLTIRCFAEAFAADKPCGLDIFKILLLRVLPPIIYIYIVNIIHNYILENGCIGFLKKRCKRDVHK